MAAEAGCAAGTSDTRPRHPRPPPRRRRAPPRPLQAFGEGLAAGVELRAGATEESELHGHPRVVALADVREGLGEDVDGAGEGEVRDGRGLGAQALGLGGGDRERVRRLADRADDDQLAQVAEQVAGELRHVAARARQPLRDLERGATVAGGDRVGGGEDQVGVGDPEHGEHVVGAQLLAAVGDELVEGAERVAEAAGRRAGDRADRAVGDLDLLGRRDPPDHLGDLLERRALEVEALAAVDDRRHHLVRLGGGEDEGGVRRRLLERLQERVPGLAGEHVRLVEDVDLPVAGCGDVADPLAQVADVVDGAVRGGVHLDHVERGPGGDRQARLALAARGQGRAVDAVERAGEDLRQRGLAGAARADEQVGVVDAVALDRVATACAPRAPGRRPRRRPAGGGGGRATSRRSPGRVYWRAREPLHARSRAHGAGSRKRRMRSKTGGMTGRRAPDHHAGGVSGGGRALLLPRSGDG